MPEEQYSVWITANKSASKIVKNDSGTGYSIITLPYSNIKITYESGGFFKIILKNSKTCFLCCKSV